VSHFFFFCLKQTNLFERHNFFLKRFFFGGVRDEGVDEWW